MSTANPTADVPLDDLQLPWSERFRQWLMHDSPSWLISTIFHLILILIIGLCMGKEVVQQMIGETAVYEAAETAETKKDEEQMLERFDIGDAPLDPTELTTESLTMTEAPAQAAQEAVVYDDNPVFEERGGGTLAGSETGAGGLGFNIKASGLGPVLKGGGGAEAGKGTGTGFGRGGSGNGFGGRGQGSREAMVGRYGGTKQTERAVAGALHWLARHQNTDGSWSCQKRAPGCRDGTCTGLGQTESLTGGTAMGLLPFLAAGQTHQSKGPYQKNINAALRWLIARQNQQTGDLTKGDHQMYAHGLAAIALCEAYGMSGDPTVGRAAQGAIQFIQTGQNDRGGWRYQHGTNDGDTSVFGWEMMALKSAQMAGLSVDPAKWELGRKWLSLVAAGARDGTSQSGGRFSYTPGGGGTPCMSAVGLLITQYMGAGRSDPTMTGGVEYLMSQMPKETDKNVYYWYYATQVMHNMLGPDWDKWNRQMRRILVESQAKSGCASGSWDPLAPTKDAWGDRGGRLMQTSLSCLTLEIYYRYLPLFQTDKEKEKPKDPNAGKADDAKDK
jgi:hypothetical protein